MSKQMAHTHRVPESRFNVDAYHHQNNERPGSFRIPGGCFLEGTTQEFDPVLFGISPVEALWLDPQQRRLLEVVYEAFESAGISLEKIAGSATGCFVGNFTADYQQMSFKEHDFRHSYGATGVDPGIVSNRISHVFNLKGPRYAMNVYFESWNSADKMIASLSTPLALPRSMRCTMRAMLFEITNVTVRLSVASI